MAYVHFKKRHEILAIHKCTFLPGHVVALNLCWGAA